MSKALKATTKKVAKSPTGPTGVRALVELRAIVARMVTQRAASIAAHTDYAVTEGAFFKVRPAAPQSQEMPPKVRAVFDNMTVAQFRDIPNDHPYAVWQNEHGTADKAAMIEWQATCARLSAEYGVGATAAAAARADKALLASQRRAMKNKATGLEAIALKVRSIRLANFDKEPDQFDGLLATIDATAAAAGFKTTV